MSKYKNYERDNSKKNPKKAGNENLKMLRKQDVEVREIDEHDLHINEHIAFMLSEEYEKASENDSQLEERFLKHINKHKNHALLRNFPQRAHRA